MVVDECGCIGYGISAVVLLALTLLFFCCNVCIALYQNMQRPPRALETQLL
jgi:hypothetical protein